MEELEAVKLDILEAGRKHGLREILLQSIAKLLEKGKINLARIISQVVAHEPIQTAILCKDLFGWELQDALYACDVTEKEWERYLIGTKVPWEYV